jgi:hypothetical protein
MKIFFYSKAGDPSGDILEKLIVTRLPEVKMEIYRTIDDLSKRLRQPTENLGIAVLLASNQEDLKNILSIHYLFQNIRILLLLPNKETEIITLAHRLRPRFLTDVNSNMEEITAVLKKMLKDH